MAVSNTGVTPSTEMAGYAMPRMPSKRATANTIPGCLTASANCWFGTFSPANYRQKQMCEFWGMLMPQTVRLWLTKTIKTIISK